MPYADADGVRLYYEEAGSGTAIVFVHEFATDHRGWEPQMRFFSRRHRCIAFNARGYPPSDVPENPDMYSQDRARDDVLAILDGLGIDKAHINGLSMGGFASLHVGFEYPERALSSAGSDSAGRVLAGPGNGVEKAMMLSSVSSWLCVRPVEGYVKSRLSCAVSGPSATPAALVWQTRQSLSAGKIQSWPCTWTVLPLRTRVASVSCAFHS